jgi:hypothetical protein
MDNNEEQLLAYSVLERHRAEFERHRAERAEARAAEAEQQRDGWKHDWKAGDDAYVKTLKRAEAAETALRKAEQWIQEVDHVEDCTAFDRTSSRECNCGRTAVLKRTGSQ